MQYGPDPILSSHNLTSKNERYYVIIKTDLYKKSILVWSF